MGFNNIKGLDPYMFEQYEQQTSKECLILSFKDIVQGKLKESFDLVIASFSLHLVPISMLNTLLFQLQTKELIVITPNKKPNITSIFSLTQEIIENRVRFRQYTKEL